ncbi:MAG TPA: phosphopantetheine-binding protein [Jatrophihabitans sp.]|nr:phosphopantetheine-binding protein [Jatrophihabitans sp.]
MSVDADFVALLRPYLKHARDVEIDGSARLRDLGLDSMRSIELLFAVEDTYGIEIPDERLTDSSFETAGSLWAVVKELNMANDGHCPA